MKHAPGYDPTKRPQPDYRMELIETLAATVERLEAKANSHFLCEYDDSHNCPAIGELLTIGKQGRKDIVADRDRWKAKAEWLAGQLDFESAHGSATTWLADAEEATR